MTAQDYAQLHEIARRYSRVEHEANDLLQEGLIAAIEAHRYDFTKPENRAWLHGVLRNKAAQLARSAVRSRQRDTRFSSISEETIDTPDTHADYKKQKVTRDFLNSLPPSARTVAVLVLHGLDRKEITNVLHITDAAFRQRLTTIRKTLTPLSLEARQAILASAYATRHGAHTDLPLGLIRKALQKRLAQEQHAGNRSLGTHDPSGHLIIIKAQNKDG